MDQPALLDLLETQEPLDCLDYKDLPEVLDQLAYRAPRERLEMPAALVHLELKEV